jgi:tryptophan 2,3-dioxygenase
MSYQDYLKLDQLLTCQKPKTDQLDEMLFIITHQTCELWFKQILLELEDLIFNFGKNEADMIEKLDRISDLFTLVINQIAILENMSPTSFSRFRTKLGCASGLQSVQFRYLESIMGIGNCPAYVEKNLTKEQLDNVVYLMKNSLLIKVDQWLSSFVVDDNNIQACDSSGKLSPRSKMAIVYILKHDTPRLKIIMRLLDLDQKLSLFRYKHIQLVQRMIGTKIGTGGMPCGYLLKTLSTNVFGEISELISKAL